MGQNFNLSDLKDVKCHLVPIGEGVKGFVYVSGKNVSHIFVDDSLSLECTAKTLAHETYHIKHDLDKISHGINLDGQREESELKADRFAAKNAHHLLKLMHTTTAI